MQEGEDGGLLQIGADGKALLRRLARRMALLPPRKFTRPPVSLPVNVETELVLHMGGGFDDHDHDHEHAHEEGTRNPA